MINPDLPEVYYDPFTHRIVRQDDGPGTTDIIKWPCVDTVYEPKRLPAAQFLRFDPADRSLHLSPDFAWRRMRIRSWDAGVVTECRSDIDCPWRPHPFDLDAPLLSLAEPDIVAGLEAGRQSLTNEMCRRHPVECFAAAIPPKARSAAGRFALVQFRLLRAMAADARVCDLIGSNPALVFLTAAFFQETSGSPVHRRGFLPLLHEKRRDIIRFAAGYEEERIVRLLSKIRCVVWNKQALADVRALLCDDARMRMISHFDIVPGAVVRWVACGRIEFPDVLAAFFHRLVASRKGPDLEALDAAADAAGQLFLDTRRLAPDRAVFVRQVNECRDLDDMKCLHDRQVLYWKNRDHELELERHRDRFGTLDFPPPPVPGSDDIVPITTVRQLIEEGRCQHHCVGGYVSEVMYGNSYIYRVIKPRRATLELVKKEERWVINQLRLACNGTADEWTWKTVTAWLG